MQRFGEKLRILRKREGITLHELAQTFGHADHTFLSRIERGQKAPPLELVMAIAQRFNITIDQLLKDEIDID